MGFTVTGAAGRLVWGYHPAGTLRAWTIAKTDGVWMLTGTPVDVDDLAVSQRPLRFVTEKGDRWQIESLQISGASLSAVLGPQESSHVPASPTA